MYRNPKPIFRRYKKSDLRFALLHLLLLPEPGLRGRFAAWIETIALHFHAPNDIAVGLVLEVADTNEIRRVMWMPVHEIQSMYASHKMWVDAVARDMASVDKSFTSLRVKPCLLSLPIHL